MARLFIPVAVVCIALNWCDSAAAQPARSPLYNYPIQYNIPVEDFIVGLYQNVMGRDPFPHEVDHWMNRMAILKSRSRMADEFIGNWQQHLEQYERDADPEFRRPAPNWRRR